jgi:hypothetical protein
MANALFQKCVHFYDGCRAWRFLINRHIDLTLLMMKKQALKSMLSIETSSLRGRFMLLLLMMLTLQQHCTLLLLVTADEAAMPQGIIEAWKEHVPGSPRTIDSEQEIVEQGSYISPVLYGGLGNCMYDLATAHAYASALNETCIVAWWDQKAIKLSFVRFHGRGDPRPGITLKAIFPNLNYVSFDPAYRDVLGAATGKRVINKYSDFGRVYQPVPASFLGYKGPKYIAGYFFSSLRM